jgi:drug/metabolite transporter (DMT)-like permease
VGSLLVVPAIETGIAYALVAAVLWGGYIYSLKRYFAGIGPASLTVGVNGAAVVWYLPVTALRVDSGSVPSLFELGVVGVGAISLTIVTVAVAFVGFVRALEVGDVSYVTPINKLVPVFVLPIEILLLNAVLTPVQLTGVVVATVAVYVANVDPGADSGFTAPLRRAVTSRAAQLALGSAVLFAVSDVGKRVVLQEVGVQTELWVPLLLGGMLLVVLPLAVREGDLATTDVPKFAVAGVAVAVAEHITSLAFALLPASVASPIINTQAVVAVVLGGIVLREAAFGIRLVAAGLAVTGVTLVAL